MSRYTFRFMSWNLNYCVEDNAGHRLQLLQDDSHWDVLALQEVSRSAWEIFTESGLYESGLYALDLFGATGDRGRQHGVALLCRHGLTLGNPQCIEGLPKVERGLAASVEGLNRPVTLVSWHAPNWAGEGGEIKRAAYLALTRWLARSQGPLVLGCDANHWREPSGLELQQVAYGVDDLEYWESRFFCADPPHRLRDALRLYYSQEPRAYEAAAKEAEEELLAVSYRQKSSGRAERFDFILVSDELSVLRCEYGYDRGISAGSDHGVVMAELACKRATWSLSEADTALLFPGEAPTSEKAS